MLVKLQLKKSVISSWILFFFMLALFAGAFISEFFQAPTIAGHQFQGEQYLFDNREFDRVNKISLSNRLDTFHLERSQEEKSSWKLTFPRELPANKLTIDKIFNALKLIKIEKVYSQDPIHISHFDLDNPLMKITLFDDTKKSETLQLGLINPIDNSAYIMLLESDLIYQVVDLDLSLIKFDLGDFIDSRIFTPSLDSISSVRIFRGNKKLGSVSLQVKSEKGEWIGKNGKELNRDKINDYLTKLSKLKSNFILDKRSEKLENRLKKTLTRPLYTIEIEDRNNNTFTYLVSSVISSLPDIKMEKRQNFIITASNRKHPYLMNKEYLNLFGKTQRTFRKLPIKKFFY